MHCTRSTDRHAGAGSRTASRACNSLQCACGQVTPVSWTSSGKEHCAVLGMLDCVVLTAVVDVPPRTPLYTRLRLPCSCTRPASVACRCSMFHMELRYTACLAQSSKVIPQPVKCQEQLCVRTLQCSTQLSRPLHGCDGRVARSISFTTSRQEIETAAGPVDAMSAPSKGRASCALLTTDRRAAASSSRQLSLCAVTHSHNNSRQCATCQSCVRSRSYKPAEKLTSFMVKAEQCARGRAYHLGPRAALRLNCSRNLRVKILS